MPQLTDVRQLRSLGMYYPRGARLDGSTQVNAMSFQRAPDEDVRDTLRDIVDQYISDKLNSGTGFPS